MEDSTMGICDDEQTASMELAKRNEWSAADGAESTKVDWAHVIKKLVDGTTLTETGSCW